ncbi:hypothetical protein FBUS_10815 [Fasciolopsis buskii]|uniref:Uncharacterized protein n=1 Tax=Fasciolopsis buskii TaxID=27845 RepID=A0A8E0RYR6_9TREM|nr:hypothetical protein FBUS_10815 [Fasciolopsis buski]
MLCFSHEFFTSVSTVAWTMFFISIWDCATLLGWAKPLSPYTRPIGWLTKPAETLLTRIVAAHIPLPTCSLKILLQSSDDSEVFHSASFTGALLYSPLARSTFGKHKVNGL